MNHQPMIADRRCHPLAGRLRSWTRLALLLLGGSVLVLVGSGTAPPASAAAPSSMPQMGNRITATSRTPVALMQTQGSLRVTFKVTPDAYGPNWFGVVLVNAATSQPIEGASIQALSTMLDMDMGTTRFTLQPQGQGFYVAQSDLGMGGHWQVVVQVRLPSDPGTHSTFTFRFMAAIWVGAP